VQADRKGRGKEPVKTTGKKRELPSDVSLHSLKLGLRPRNSQKRNI
jgi:hypothetical protein